MESFDRHIAGCLSDQYQQQGTGFLWIGEDMRHFGLLKTTIVSAMSYVLKVHSKLWECKLENRITAM